MKKLLFIPFLFSSCFATSLSDLPYAQQRLYSRIYDNEPACISTEACYSKEDNFNEWTKYLNQERIAYRSHHLWLAKQARLHQYFFSKYLP